MGKVLVNLVVLASGTVFPGRAIPDEQVADVQAAGGVLVDDSDPTVAAASAKCEQMRVAGKEASTLAAVMQAAVNAQLFATLALGKGGAPVVMVGDMVLSGDLYCDGLDLAGHTLTAVDVTTSQSYAIFCRGLVKLSGGSISWDGGGSNGGAVNTGGQAGQAVAGYWSRLLTPGRGRGGGGGTGGVGADGTPGSPGQSAAAQGPDDVIYDMFGLIRGIGQGAGGALGDSDGGAFGPNPGGPGGYGGGAGLIFCADFDGAGGELTSNGNPGGDGTDGGNTGGGGGGGPGTIVVIALRKRGASPATRFNPGAGGRGHGTGTDGGAGTVGGAESYVELIAV